jgi:hypothetical protein
MSVRFHTSLLSTRHSLTRELLTWLFVSLCFLSSSMR